MAAALRNDLFSRKKEGKWIGDIPNNGMLNVVMEDDDNARLKLESTSQGTPFNVMLDLGHEDEGSKSMKPMKNAYFEINLAELEGNVSVGIATLEEFQRGGWKSTGMFYNGNVTNGAAALIVGFGDSHLVQGDTVGVRWSREGSGGGATTALFIYVNGQCLGAAFRLACDEKKHACFFPCMHVSGKASVLYTVPEDMPTVMDREHPVPKDDKYRGKWKLEQAVSGPERGKYEIPQNHDVVLLLALAESSSPTRRTYHLSIKLGNTLRTSLHITDKLESFDSVAVSPRIMSTRMMPPPQLYKLETFVSTALPTIHKMTIRPEDASLIMVAPGAEFTFRRFLNSFRVLSKYE